MIWPLRRRQHHTLYATEVRRGDLIIVRAGDGWYKVRRVVQPHGGHRYVRLEVRGGRSRMVGPRGLVEVKRR